MPSTNTTTTSETRRARLARATLRVSRARGPRAAFLALVQLAERALAARDEALRATSRAARDLGEMTSARGRAIQDRDLARDSWRVTRDELAATRRELVHTRRERDDARCGAGIARDTDTRAEELAAELERIRKAASALGRTRTWGIEIELVGPRDWGQRARMALPEGWEVRPDGSIRPPRSSPEGWEIVSPPMPDTRASREELRGVLATLTALRARPHRSCGIHVHVGAPELVIAGSEERARWLAAGVARQAALLARVSAKRKASAAYATYAMEIMAGMTERAWYGTRYRSMNGCALAKHGTIEYRSHESSTSACRVLPWITACVSHYEAALGEARP